MKKIELAGIFKAIINEFISVENENQNSFDEFINIH